MDWLDLLAVQGTLKSLLQHHSSKASILLHSGLMNTHGSLVNCDHTPPPGVHNLFPIHSRSHITYCPPSSSSCPLSFLALFLFSFFLSLLTASLVSSCGPLFHPLNLPAKIYQVPGSFGPVIWAGNLRIQWWEKYGPSFRELTRMWELWKQRLYLMLGIWT